MVSFGYKTVYRSFTTVSIGRIMANEKLPSASGFIPLMLRLPPELHKDIKDMAEHERRSLNTMVVLLLESQIKRKKKSKPPATHPSR